MKTKKYKECELEFNNIDNIVVDVIITIDNIFLNLNLANNHEKNTPTIIAIAIGSNGATNNKTKTIR